MCCVKRNPVLTEHYVYEEPGQQRQDYKDRCRSRSLLSVRAASQSLEIWYLVDFLNTLSVRILLRNKVFQVGGRGKQY